MASLHAHIKSCDQTLENMQMMLRGFQDHLGGLSSEIKQLQGDTLSLNIKLSNRREAEASIVKFVDSLNFDPSFMSAINDGDVNESYAAPLAELGTRLDFLVSCKDYASVKETASMMDRLRVKAASKIKLALSSRFVGLAQPRANLTNKQTALGGLRFCYQFLAKHCPDDAAEMRQLYIDTIGLEYFNNIKTYLSALMKLKEDDVGSSSELLGTDEVKGSGFFSMGSKSCEDINQNFLLRMRDVILTPADADAVAAKFALDRDTKMAYEEILRHALRLLIDFALPEASFLSTFFDHKAMFSLVMKRVTQYLTDSLETWMSNTNDIIAVMLVIRVINGLQDVGHRRTAAAVAAADAGAAAKLDAHGAPVFCLDYFFDRLLQFLWPKYQTILDAHKASIHTAKRIKDKDQPLQTHYVAVRFAWFALAVRVMARSLPSNRQAALAAGAPAGVVGAVPVVVEEQLGRNLVALTKELELLLAAAVKEIQGPKRQATFCINNYEFIVGTLQEREIRECDELTYFTAALDKYLAAFVEEELNEKFSRMMTLIKSHAPPAGAAAGAAAVADEGARMEVCT